LVALATDARQMVAAIMEVFIISGECLQRSDTPIIIILVK
jgi:hypothetical protein